MCCMDTSMHECTVQCILLYCRHMHTYAGLSEWACVSWIWQSGENQVLSLHISGTSDHTISVYCKRFPPRVSETNWALRSTGQMPFHLNAPPGWIPIQRVPSDNLIQRCWFTKLWEIYKAHNTLKPIPKKSTECKLPLVDQGRWSHNTEYSTKSQTDSWTSNFNDFVVGWLLLYRKQKGWHQNFR